MAKSTETGHVKNVTNFKTLITIIEGFGAEYAPSEESIQLPALKGMYEDANSSIQALTAAMPAYTTAVDEQEAAYASLPKLVTKVSNAHAAVATKEAIETVDSLKKKINGNKPKGPSGEEAAKLAEEGKESDTCSTSQRSYDNLQQNFEELLQTVAANPNTSPTKPT